MTDKTDKTNNEQTEKRLTQARFLGRLRGKQVTVVCMDGKALKGELLDFDRFTLFIKQASGLEIAVFKHAIKYLCLAATRTDE